MDLQEQLDAEAVMGRFVSILAEGVRKFGGTVDKFTGDGIMALFGVSVAQEDRALGQGGQMTCAAGPQQQLGVRWAGADGTAAYGAGGSAPRGSVVGRTRTAQRACWSTFRGTPPT